ncbi:major capsid family protein, partial [Ralstonia mannitolilytica]
AKFGLLVSMKVSSAGNISVLEYLKQNTISNSINGRPLNIQPLKWLYQRGTSNADRMMAYTKEQDKVRFPMVPLQRTPLEYRDIRQLTTYFGRLGVVEVVYPELIGYRDGI